MKKRIAVVGYGLIGRRHVQAIRSSLNASLWAIVDPEPCTKAAAELLQVGHFDTLKALLSNEKPDGVVLATPNQLHTDQALACIAAGIPALVEKPLAADLEGAMSIVKAAEKASVPICTGHHRRHNPLVQQAKKLITEGKLGRLTTVQATTWLYKPDDYFDVAWRTQPGAGPVYINLIHDIDMLRHLCGEVVQVQAMESSETRGHKVEDTCVILLRFLNGALGTLSVSDCTVSPWSWELTSKENPAYPTSGELCYQIGGTHGSVALPDVSLWCHPDQRSWWEPIYAIREPFPSGDPLVYQIEQFVEVLEGRQEPLVSARDGMLNQQIIDAIKRSAKQQSVVDINLNLCNL